MSKLNRDELIKAVTNKEILDKELYIKLNNLTGDRIHGVSIPYFTGDRKLYIFTSYEEAIKAEEKLNNELEELAKQQQAQTEQSKVKEAVKIEKQTYIGKINKAKHNIDVKKDPVEFVTTLDVILTNAKFMGMKAVVFNYNPEEDEQSVEIEINELIEKLGISAEQPRLLMSEEERNAVITNGIPVQLRFNPINILNYVNPFSIDNQKGLDLSQLLFDDEADRLEELLEDLQYHELAYLSHQIIKDYIPMAKDMENKEMEDNFNSYLETLRKYIGKKLVADLKEEKAFYLILNQTEKGMVIQSDANGVVPFLYTDYFSTNNTNPFCLINNFETFKQFMSDRKPTGLQLSAGPTATVMLESKYIKTM